MEDADVSSGRSLEDDPFFLSVPLELEVVKPSIGEDTSRPACPVVSLVCRGWACREPEGVGKDPIVSDGGMGIGDMGLEAGMDGRPAVWESSGQTKDQTRDNSDQRLTILSRSSDRFERLFFFCLLVFTTRYDLFIFIPSGLRDVSERRCIGACSGYRTSLSSGDHCRTQNSSGAVGSDNGGLQASKDSTLKPLERAWRTSATAPSLGRLMETRRVLCRLGLEGKSEAGGYLYRGGRSQNVGGVGDRALGGKSEGFLKISRFSASIVHFYQELYTARRWSFDLTWT